jgi:hypothetical protein
MNVRKMYDSLCKPAQFYLIIASVAYIIMLLQNLGTRNTFTMGTYTVDHQNPGLVLIVNALYILLWTWLLNMICKINPKISWVIVLLPFILLFLALGIMMFSKK